MALGIQVEVVANSPLFDERRAEAIIDSWLVDVRASFGQQGLSELHFWMDQYFKNPTPYYETQVVAQNMGEDMVIHDRGIIYGPWLDGSGSRNATTRFKGYAHWRRAFQYLNETEGPQILDRHTPDLINRLKGN